MKRKTLGWADCSTGINYGWSSHADPRCKRRRG